MKKDDLRGLDMLIGLQPLSALGFTTVMVDFFKNMKALLCSSNFSKNEKISKKSVFCENFSEVCPPYFIGNDVYEPSNKSIPEVHV